jgi:hypothetical protein
MTALWGATGSGVAAQASNVVNDTELVGVEVHCLSIHAIVDFNPWMFLHSSTVLRAGQDAKAQTCLKPESSRAATTQATQAV